MCKHKSKIPVTDEEEQAVKTLLESIGQDTTREGLQDTPKRYVRFLKEFTNPPKFNMTTFDAEDNDEMVIVDNIPFFSLCEHHLAPFFGTAAIAYIPDNKIVGLSKLPRTLDHFSRQPQNQERITQQVAAFLMKELKPKGVAVIIKARHLCVEMRGVKKHDTWTTTSAMKGAFKDNQTTRQEFLQLLKK
jgi:GTP cyclohydrolase I